MTLYSFLLASQMHNSLPKKILPGKNALIHFWLGLCPRPHWGSLHAPDCQLVIRGEGGQEDEEGERRSVPVFFWKLATHQKTHQHTTYISKMQFLCMLHYSIYHVLVAQQWTLVREYVLMCVMLFTDLVLPTLQIYIIFTISIKYCHQFSPSMLCQYFSKHKNFVNWFLLE